MISFDRHPRAATHKIRVIAFSILLLLLSATAAALTFVILDRQRYDITLVNIAGRQRMLAQQLTLEVILLQARPQFEHQQSLVYDAHRQFDSTLRALAHGGETTLPSGGTFIVQPASNAEIQAQLRVIYGIWEDMDRTLDIAMNERTGDANAAVNKIARTITPRMVSELDKLIALYEAESNRRIFRLEVIQLGVVSAAIIVLALTIQIAGRSAASLDKLELLEAEARRAQELETLQQVGAVVAATLRQDESIERILQQLLRVVPYDSASVMLLKDGYLEIVGGHGWADAATVVGMRFPVPSDNPNTVVLERREPYLLGNAAKVYSAFRLKPHNHIRSWMGVPLVVGERLIGILAVDSRQENYFTSHHARLASAFANQVAIAIDNARLYSESRKRAEQLRALHEASRALTSDLNLEAVLQTLTETARHLIDARYAALAVLDSEEKMSQFHTAGLGEEERKRIGKPPQGHGLLGAILIEGKPIRLADISSDPRSVGFPPGHPKMSTFVGIPIITRGRVIGSLYLTEKEGGQEFDQDDEEFLVGLAGDAAIAIENAQLFRKVEKLATTDSLTGLYNRRHFMERAESEFQRARRYRRPLSLIMADIDRFKRVNDTYGHGAGDQVLKFVASLARAELREMDVIGRYGGEEFIILMPETGLEGARSLAERFRKRIEETVINVEQAAISITISLGVSVLQEGCETFTALIEAGDKALYEAKAAGRNRAVCVDMKNDED